MDKGQEERKQCCCARCMMPIDKGDLVVIEGETFHKRCSLCSVCGKVPTSIKPFWGQVFCPECFQNHVLNMFPEQSSRAQVNSWLMNWALGMSGIAGVAAKETQEKVPKHEEVRMHEEVQRNEKVPKHEEVPMHEEVPKENAQEQPKCCCARCQKAIESGLVEIGGQSFHEKCAQCCCCNCAANASMKYHNGLVFCSQCYRIMMQMNQKPQPDNLSAFYGMCFELWKNPSIAAQMKEFMSGGSHEAPSVTIHQGEGFCRRGQEERVGACS